MAGWAMWNHQILGNVAGEKIQRIPYAQLGSLVDLVLSYSFTMDIYIYICGLEAILVNSFQPFTHFREYAGKSEYGLGCLRELLEWNAGMALGKLCPIRSGYLCILVFSILQTPCQNRTMQKRIGYINQAGCTTACSFLNAGTRKG